MKSFRLFIGIFVLGLAAASALAQHSEWSAAIVGVSTIGENGIYALSQEWANDASTTSAFSSTSFTGMDRLGATQTMFVEGTTIAKSNYGRLRNYTAASVANNYYNAGNAKTIVNDIFDPAGSPDAWVSLGFAGFTDTLHYGGALGAGYKARYLFQVDGTFSGDGTFASLSAKVGDAAWEEFFFYGVPSVNGTFATGLHEIDGINPQRIQVQFSSQVVFNMFDLADGANASGISDFSSTAILSGIEVYDSSGNLVSGWTVSSESGTVYPVPEPISMLVLGAGVLGLMRRRR